MGRNQVYCCVCGAPFLEAGQREDTAEYWLTHAILLTTGHNTDKGIELDTYKPQLGQFALDLCPNPVGDSQRRVLQLDAQYDDHNRFLILESDKAVEAFSVDAGGGPLYLAVHKLCVHLAERFIDSRAKAQDKLQTHPDEGISSIDQLWKVLYRRLPGSFHPSEYILPDPYEYYGGRGCRNVYWEPEDDPEDGQLLEANPVEIPDLTKSILHNLRPEGSERSDKILTDDDLDSQLTQETSKSMSKQERCYEALVDKTLFPWLWDMDVELMHKRQQDGNWDWQLLVHTLSKFMIHDSGDANFNLPLGLKNRRRIWRCLEDARVDDVAREMQAPRP